MSETGNAQQQPLIEPTGAPPLPQPPTYEQATGESKSAAAVVAANGPTVVVVTEPALIYGPHPIDIQCPYCHNFCRTRIRYEATSRTHLIALVLCFLQLYCCVCLPYCIGSCMNANHYCGMCDKYLATYKR